MSRDDSAEDLLVLARQCRLGEEEERRFEIAVGSSRELELLYDAGVHFDEQAGVLPGDETRFSRLVERTLARVDRAGDAPEARFAQGAQRAVARSTHRALAARYFGASLAFGLLLSVALASAWDYVEQRRSPQHAADVPAKLASRSRPEAAPRAAALAAAPVASPSAQASALPTTPPAANAPRVAPPPPVDRKTDVPDEELSSSQLFARANQARREGDIEAAISLYEQLGQKYPSSVEADDAKVLVGNLLLSQRSPRAALRQFENYGAGGSGALTLEALWGQAQALRKLGSPDEKAILLELVRDYPDSPYAEAARKRLGELSP
jgi:TolA-binding protein